MVQEYKETTTFWEKKLIENMAKARKTVIVNRVVAHISYIILIQNTIVYLLHVFIFNI